MSLMNTTPLNTEEKFWSVLAHLSAFTGGVGLLIPIYGWIENRQKSAYACFQSLQALFYQSVGYTLWAVLYLVVLIGLSIFTLPGLLQNLTTGTAEIGPWLTTHALVIFGLYGLYLLVPLVGALLCALGREFHYPLLGRPIARFLHYLPGEQPEALDETHADRFAASMGHFCVIYPLWGLFVPVAVLVTQGGRSRYLKFQALQTIVFQVATALVTLILGIITFVVLLSALLPFALAKNPAEPPIESLLGAMLFLVCLGVLILVVPLFQILGQWAGLRVLQGHDYRYPLVGRLVENWLAKREAAAPLQKEKSV